MSPSYLLIINISFAFYYFSGFVKIEIIVADYYLSDDNMINNTSG